LYNKYDYTCSFYDLISLEQLHAANVLLKTNVSYNRTI